MGLFPKVTTDPVKAERYSQIRRASYIMGVTAYCVLMPGVFVLMKIDSGLADLVSRSLLSLAELCVMLYLGAGVLDRSKILDKVGEGIANRPGNTVVITPPKEEK